MSEKVAGREMHVLLKGWEMTRKDSRGAVMGRLYSTKPMSRHEDPVTVEDVLEAMRELSEVDRELVVEMVRRLARLQTPQK